VADEVVFNPSGQLASLWQAGSVGPLAGKSYWGPTAIESYEPSNNMAYFAHRDWVGTRRAITNASGAISNDRSSLPFGDGGATHLALKTTAMMVLSDFGVEIRA